MTKKLNKQQLEELVHTLSWNDRFGCYTRPGLEQYMWSQIGGKAKFVIFIDVDDMHDLNVHHGYEGVNQIIKDSLSILRSTDFISGQWFSGDEFAVFVTDDPGRGASDPLELCERLRKSFNDHGASATFGIAPVTSPDLNLVVRPAFELVQNAKKNDRRGTINSI
jgi:FOG: GGDEF domain